MKRFESNISLIVLAVALLAFFVPQTFSWIGASVISPMLGIVMFGMGLTLKTSDFKPVFVHPKEIIIGELAQFLVMPSVAWLLCRLLQLPTELAIGVILVGCCPGGTASNVMCYLAKGNVAMSVAMTAVSTLLAPVVTPALVLLLGGQAVEVNVVGMFLSIVQVVILPIALGLAVNRFFGGFARKVEPALPMVSTVAIALIVGIVVSANSGNIRSCSLLVALAVMLHNGFGLLFGYLIGLVFGLKPQDRTAISIEVGMQNSGLATSLAATHFAMYPMATVPGALFSVWHNISGSIAAQIFKRSSRQAS